MQDIIREAITALQSEAAGYSPGVRLWMRIMALSFLSGIVFFFHKAPARGIVLATLLTILGLIISKALFPDVSRSLSGSLIHMALWIPLLLWIWQSKARSQWGADTGIFNRIYFIWLCWVSVLMALSLIMDVYYLVMR